MSYFFSPISMKFAHKTNLDLLIKNLKIVLRNFSSFGRYRSSKLQKCELDLRWPQMRRVSFCHEFRWNLHTRPTLTCWLRICHQFCDSFLRLDATGCQRRYFLQKPKSGKILSFDSYDFPKSIFCFSHRKMFSRVLIQNIGVRGSTSDSKLVKNAKNM